MQRQVNSTGSDVIPVTPFAEGRVQLPVPLGVEVRSLDRRTDMSLRQEDREDRVRRRAYQLWQDAGLHDGGSVEREVAEEANTHSRVGESFPANDPERPAKVPSANR
jgi:hypothetical protein